MGIGADTQAATRNTRTALTLEMIIPVMKEAAIPPSDVRVTKVPINVAALTFGFDPDLGANHPSASSFIFAATWPCVSTSTVTICMFTKKKQVTSKNVVTLGGAEGNAMKVSIPSAEGAEGETPTVKQAAIPRMDVTMA
mmetsp:Transcript_52068/g.111453  ORF Transcript_52068/g.111453 Transcript_52068/m.111453 type:complete len:139 (+) Transcript_52068:1104-1520(+)